MSAPAEALAKLVALGEVALVTDADGEAGEIDERDDAPANDGDGDGDDAPNEREVEREVDDVDEAGEADDTDDTEEPDETHR
jgi:hypothetical protein